MIESPYLATPGGKLNLSKCKTSDTGKFKDKSDAVDAAQKNLEKLDQLQEVLYAGHKHAILIVLQAMDAGGKDGAIEHVFSGLNPQGCSVTSFKVPTALESSHDFLWRIHEAAPPKGMIGIFNRSHYESVLVERVKKLVPKSAWKSRYEHINAFEKLLADEGTVILKFFLHISKEEQKERLQARLDDEAKNWKFNPGDLLERDRWADYLEAYEEAIKKCSTKWAPWYIVPSDKKWFRNWVISDTIVKAMEELKMKFPPPAAGLEKIRIK